MVDEKPLQPKYKRVLLKLSGEAMGGVDSALDSEKIRRYASEIHAAHMAGVQVAVVVGGGNIFRGSMGESLGIPKKDADYMGMMATCINGIALQNVLEKHFNLDTRVMSAISMNRMCEEFIHRKATSHLDNGKVVILVAGSGNPNFTTDTAAVLRATETEALIVMKATNVDGVYDDDPSKNPEARRYRRLGFDVAMELQLGVMDSTAMAMSRDNKLPILVFSLRDEGSITRALLGEEAGTLVVPGREAIYYE